MNLPESCEKCMFAINDPPDILWECGYFSSKNPDVSVDITLHVKRGDDFEFGERALNFVPDWCPLRIAN